MEVKVTWKIIKLPVKLKLQKDPGIITQLVGVRKPQGYWGDEIKACLDLSTANFHGSLIFSGKLIALQLWGGNKEQQMCVSP